jgi:hypothetical protein
MEERRGAMEEPGGDRKNRLRRLRKIGGSLYIDARK